MTGIVSYDGKTGWKIEPWSGKKDAEALGEEELKQVVEDSDLDGALVDYQKKETKSSWSAKMKSKVLTFLN